MEVDCRVQMDADTNAGSNKPTTARVSAGSKLTMVLLLATLCLAAAAAAAVLVFDRQAEGRDQDEDSLDIHHTLRQISKGRAAIHLQGELNPDMKTSLEWKNNVDQAHSQEGLELEDNEIVIPKDGLYFVYSQSAFHVNCNSGTDDITSMPMVYVRPTVQLWSKTYGDDDAQKSYETILQAVRTVCQKTVSSNPDQGGRWYSSIYMGALFNLNSGDRLKTVMEEKMLSNVDDGPGQTFFGVFAL